MRKIIFLMHVTLDGYVAGPNGEMDWIVYNDEVAAYAYTLHASTDAAIYGRVTYDMMHAYWPTVLTNPESGPGEMAHAQWYDAATKIVISRSLDTVEGTHTVLIGDNLMEEISRIKQQPGKDIWLLGSPSVAQALMKLGLIDEYRLNVNPVILGAGKHLFGELETPLKLNLVESQKFDGGVIALRYVPESG